MKLAATSPNKELAPIVDSNKIIDWVNSKWKCPQCSFCGGNEFSVGNAVYQFSEFKWSGIDLGETVVPCVLLTCICCGVIIPVNPMVVANES